MQVETRRSGSMRTLFKDVPQAYLAPLTLSILRPSRTHLPHALVPIRTRTLRAHLLPASTNPRPLLLAPSPLTSYPRAQTLSLFPLSPSLLTSYAQSQTLALVPLSPSVLNSYPQSETLALSLPVAPHPAAPRSRAAPTLRRSTSTSPKNAAPTPRRRTSSISSPTPLRTASPNAQLSGSAPQRLPEAGPPTPRSRSARKPCDTLVVGPSRSSRRSRRLHPATASARVS